MNASLHPLVTAVGSLSFLLECLQGTTYTLKLIQQYTNTTTATNYGNEQGIRGTSIPVRPNLDQGPFFRYPHQPHPSRYILTKTHCGGHDLSHNPSYYIISHRLFEEKCRKGNRILNNTQVKVVYNESIARRAVHLIRNPIDNIVARLHNQQKHWQRKKNRQEHLQKYNSTKEGFLAWCQYQDSMDADKQFLNDELWNLTKGVPCFAEFFRYTRWHTLAREIKQRRQGNFPVHTMYYEDFTKNWNETVDRLFEFLELSPADGAKPLEFISGKHYANYFDTHQVAQTGRFVKALAPSETWELLRHYFE
jgi:hypothetical protein